MTPGPLFFNIFNLGWPGVAKFADFIKILTMFIKKVFKYLKKKLKNLEIMYHNAIYVCIF